MFIFLKMSSGELTRLLILTILPLICIGQDYVYRSSDSSPPPELDFPGLDDLEDGNEGVFNPTGVVEGMVIGEIYRRIERLEALCEADGKTIKAEDTFSFSDHDKTSGFDSNFNTNLFPDGEEGVQGGTEEYLVPDPLDPDWEGGALVPTARQVQKNLDEVQQQLETVSAQQKLIREDVNRLKDELTRLKSEAVEARDILTAARRQMKSSLQDTNEEVKAQDLELERLILSVSTIEGTLSGVHQTIADLAQVNKSVTAVLKDQMKHGREVLSLTENVSELRGKVGDLELSWSSANASTAWGSSRMKKHVARLQREIGGMRAKLKKVDTMKCEAGRVLFMNYPFAHGRWPQIRHIRFSKAFTSRPKLTYGMTQLDVNYRYNTRARLRLVKMNNAGFTLSCDGWYNTRLYKVEVSWMACLV